MKRIFIMISCLLCAGFVTFSCTCNGPQEKTATGETVAGDTTKTDTAMTEKKITASMLPDEPVFDIVTNLGTMRVKLYAKTPKHRDNFVKLALDGFYDGILFHRVINGFMIQAGDPLTKDPANKEMYGTGGPGYTVPAEFVNEYYHKKGALAAARRGDAANPKKASSGSQFYIVQDEMACLPLDGEYTIFGETVDGLDVVDSIASVATDRMDCPVNDVKILSVTPVLE